MNRKLPAILKQINIDRIKRIDIALEGNWNDTVVTVWDKNKGFIGFDKVIKSHQSFKPSIELYFTDTGVGIHCFKIKDNLNIFDDQYALDIIEFIENNVKHNVKNFIQRSC